MSRRKLNTLTVVTGALTVLLLASWMQSTRDDVYRLVLPVWHGIAVGACDGRLIINVRSSETGYLPPAGISKMPTYLVGWNDRDYRAVPTPIRDDADSEMYDTDFLSPSRVHFACSMHERQPSIYTAISGARPVSGKRYLEIILPHWALLLIAAPLPTFRAVPAISLWRRGRRLRKMSTCRKCGYDLRASPVRCPECGTLRTSRAKAPITRPTRQPSPSSADAASSYTDTSRPS